MNLKACVPVDLRKASISTNRNLFVCQSNPSSNQSSDWQPLINLQDDKAFE